MNENKNYYIPEEEREVILNLTIKVLFFFTLPLTIFSWLRILKIGFLPVMAFHLFLFILVTGAFILRERLQPNFKSHLIIFVFYGIGLAGIPTQNLIIYGFPCCILGTVLANFLFNKKVAINYLIVQAVSILFLGIFFTTMEKAQMAFELVGYIAFQYFIIVSLGRIGNSLVELIKKSDLALETKTRFLALMSHELRTPLTGVVLAADMIHETAKDEESKKLAEVIRSSTKSLGAIINDVLDFSKIESKNFELYQQDFSLRELIENLHKNYSFQAEQGSLDFTVNVEVEYEHLHGDSVRLEQILRNLLSNAFKFTDEGEIILKITQYEDEFTFEVSDTGIGIDEERLKHIFNEFEQESNETSVEFGGTGLGLSIVERLVKLQEGSVQVKSEKGLGSIFTVTIPYRKADEPQNIGIDRTKEKAEKFDHLKVILFEDNKTNAKLFISKLKRLGITNILHGLDGGAGIEKMKDQEIDLVLMDVKMVPMDGLEATQRIRNGEAGANHKNVKIFGLSANNYQDDIQKGFDAGMNEYLEKPLNKEKLINLLARYF